MKRSIGLRGQPASLTAGKSALRGGSNAQCVVHDAPCSTHWRRVSICRAVNCLPDFFGGILASASSVSIRKIRSLSSAFPGMTAALPDLSLASTPSLVSSRKPALRVLSSGP